MSEQKIEQFWRDATADDISRMMKGENVNARFRDKNSHEWTASGELLAGYDSTEESEWIDDTGCPWRFCQVYDPPQWYIDKPDPGEGWRLLEKFPDEEPKENDQFFDRDIWLPARLHLQQIHGTWYRRRIEPVNSDPGGDWEPTDEEIQYAMDSCRVPTIKVCDAAQIAGHSPIAANNEFRKFVDKVQAGEVSYTCSFVWEGQLGLFKVKVGDRIQHPNGCCIDITETGFKVNATLDTVEFGK